MIFAFIGLFFALYTLIVLVSANTDRQLKMVRQELDTIQDRLSRLEGRKK